MYLASLPELNIESFERLKVKENKGVSSLDKVVTLANCGTLELKEGKSTQKFTILQRRKELPWCAMRLEKDRLSANFQGNPLWPNKVLKAYPKLLHHFSLDRNFDEETVVLPTVENINEKLKSLFSKLGHKMERGYFFQKNNEDSDPLSDQEYVDQFIDQRVLPMAPIHQVDFVHDWSFHFFTLLFPDLLERLRNTLKHIRENISPKVSNTCYKWNYYGSTESSPGQLVGQKVTEPMSYSSALYRQMAISLDVATAKPIQLFLLLESTQKLQLNTELKAIENYFHEDLKESLPAILWQERNLDQFLKKDVDKSKEHSMPLPLQQMKESLALLENTL